MTWRNNLESKGVSAALAVNQRTSVRLTQGVQTHRWQVTVRGTVTQAGGAATRILNRGSILAMLQMAINENGRDRNSLVEPRMLRFLTEAMSPSALTSTTRWTNTANGAYALQEQYLVYAAVPLAVAPRETAYLENDPRVTFSLDFLLKSTNGNSILAVNGAGTTTISAVSVEVEQDFVQIETGLPYFIPTYRELRQNVTQASSRDSYFIKSQASRIRAMLMLQESDEGEVSDIITSFATLGDGGATIVGPSQMTWSNFVRMGQYDFGGNVLDATAQNAFSYGLMWFQRSGRLNAVLDPSRYVNLRHEFTDLPSVTGVGTGSRIVTMMCELERPMATTQGRTLVTPELPAYLS